MGKYIGGISFWIIEFSLYSWNTAAMAANGNYTFMLENPKILKLVVLVHLLYLEIGEGSEVEMFTGWIKFCSELFLNISASYSLYSRRYDSSKLGFQPLSGFSLKQVT